MKIKLITLALLIALVSPVEASITDRQCLTYMVYKESRGEPIRAMRAVLDVAYNRMRIRSLTACQVLMEKSQYPYARHGVKTVKDKKFLTQFSIVYKMASVLDKDYVYFNTVRHRFGKQHRKIGRLTFSK